MFPFSLSFREGFAFCLSYEDVQAVLADGVPVFQGLAGLMGGELSHTLDLSACGAG